MSWATRYRGPIEAAALTDKASEMVDGAKDSLGISDKAEMVDGVKDAAEMADKTDAVDGVKDAAEMADKVSELQEKAELVEKGADLLK